MTKEEVLEAIKWSERMSTKEAEHLYSVTSEKYHIRIYELYQKHLRNIWIKNRMYRPVYNPNV